MGEERRRFFRIDFIQHVISVDEEKGTFEAIIVPNPRRYEWKKLEGEEYLYDKFDNIVIPKSLLFELAKDMEGVPIYYQPQQIGNAEEYVHSRKPVILQLPAENDQPIGFVDKSEEFLESLSENRLAFVIMVVDIVGSTKLSTQLEPEKYRRLITTTLHELGEVIPKFHGYVLKYTGDGLIAYFPEPSFITKNDLAIDCALTIRRLVNGGLNAIFEAQGYPTIQVRIGLDSGDAYIVTVGSPQTKRHKDIIGSVVSLAAKIQSLAEPGRILLGAVTERNLHTMWREICEEVELPDDWEYEDEDGLPYRVYGVKFE